MSGENQVASLRFRRRGSISPKKGLGSPPTGHNGIRGWSGGTSSSDKNVCAHGRGIGQPGRLTMIYIHAALRRIRPPRISYEIVHSHPVQSIRFYSLQLHSLRCFIFAKIYSSRIGRCIGSLLPSSTSPIHCTSRQASSAYARLRSRWSFRLSRRGLSRTLTRDTPWCTSTVTGSMVKRAGLHRDFPLLM